MRKFTIFICIMFSIAFTAKSQLMITPDTNTIQLVNDFILTGVSASNVIYNGAPLTLGTFNNGSSTNIGMTDGIILTTGTLDTSMSPSIGNPVSDFASYMNSFSGDPDLDLLIPGHLTYDASILEFDLVPVGNILEFQYVFGSEEYPEFVNSGFNDVFGFFISGTNPSGGTYSNENIAIIPGTTLPVSINNVNAGFNSTYFIDNQTLNGQSIVFDGFTTVLTAQLSVTPLSSYHLKMAIADAGDGVFDSGIFLKAQSMKSYNSVGIDENQKKSTSIFPNPLTRNSVMTFNGEVSGKINFTITDFLGKNIFSTSIENIQTEKQTFPVGKILNDSPSGMYFINIENNGKSIIEKVIK